jgi:hypothetical protein
VFISTACAQLLRITQAFINFQVAFHLIAG